MAMEQGVHRLHRERGGDLRVRLDVVPAVSRGRAQETARTAAARRRAGALGIEVAWAGRVERDETGLSVELGGPSRPTMEALFDGLERAAADLVQPLEPARIYAQGGTGARDPRSGAVVPRYRDAMRGGLDPLLEGWRRMRRRRVST